MATLIDESTANGSQLLSIAKHQRIALVLSSQSSDSGAFAAYRLLGTLAQQGVKLGAEASEEALPWAGLHKVTSLLGVKPRSSSAAAYASLCAAAAAFIEDLGLVPFAIIGPGLASEAAALAAAGAIGLEDGLDLASSGQVKTGARGDWPPTVPVASSRAGALNRFPGAEHWRMLSATSPAAVSSAVECVVSAAQALHCTVIVEVCIGPSMLAGKNGVQRQQAVPFIASSCLGSPVDGRMVAGSVTERATLEAGAAIFADGGEVSSTRAAGTGPVSRLPPRALAPQLCWPGNPSPGERKSQEQHIDAFHADSSSESPSGSFLGMASRAAQLHVDTRTALKALADAAEGGYFEEPGRVQVALTLLSRHVSNAASLARARAPLSNSSSSIDELEAIAKDADDTFRAVNLTASQLLALRQRRPKGIRDIAGTKLVQMQLNSVSKVMEGILGSHKSALQHLSNRVQGIDPPFAQNEDEGEDEDEELSLATARALASGRKSAAAASSTLRSVTQQLSLLADMLVDGGLLRIMLSRAVAELPSNDSKVADEPYAAQVTKLMLHPGSSDHSKSPIRWPLQEPLVLKAATSLLGADLRGRMPSGRNVFVQTGHAFLLAEEMADRLKVHGLLRSGSADGQLMRRSWKRLRHHLSHLLRQNLQPEKDLGKAFSRHLNIILAALAPAPASCEAALEAARGSLESGSSQWAVWDALPSSDDNKTVVVLLRGGAWLTRHSSNGQLGQKMKIKTFDLAQEATTSTGAMIVIACEMLRDTSSDLQSQGLAILRPLAPGEVVLCPGNTNRKDSVSSSCAGIFQPPFPESFILSLLTIPEDKPQELKAPTTAQFKESAKAGVLTHASELQIMKTAVNGGPSPGWSRELSSDTCTRPTAVSGYLLTELSLTLSTFRVAVKCADGYFGGEGVIQYGERFADITYPGPDMATVCQAPNAPYTLSGCLMKTCAVPSNAVGTGYEVTQNAAKRCVPTWGVTASCANGYIGTAVVSACSTHAQPYSLSGCTKIDVCTTPSQLASFSAYVIVETETLRSIPTWGVTASCASGYHGTAAVTPRQGDGEPYLLTGCMATVWGVATTAGYDVTQTEVSRSLNSWGFTAMCTGGYYGTASASACQANDEPDVLSGCSPYSCSEAAIPGCHTCLEQSQRTATNQCGVCESKYFLKEALCEACASCASGKYRTGCSGANPGTCTACSSRPSGQYKTGWAGFNAGTRSACSSCPDGQFRAGCNGTNACVCTGCSAGQSSCPACAAGKFAAAPGTLARVQKFFPDRFLGEEMLLAWADGRPVKRLEIQREIGRSAEAHGGSAHHVGSHSLKFGGTSALWAAFRDSGLVKRWGRWASDCFHGYLWDSREGARGISEARATADLTPV
jgi:hypothetical protein